MAALVLISAAIHWTALRGWWLYDDPQLLIEAIRQPVWGVLFDPAEYTHLASHSFTPLLLLSFKLDLALHGLTPAVFYAHQVVALTAAAILMYVLLRRYVADLYAAGGAAVFLTTWAAVYAARTLMIRHYVEGLLFALAALLFWSVGLRRAQRRWHVVAALCYLAAMLCKEVYAPIPLLLVCQARYERHRWREVARDLIAPAIALAVFLAWRWYMLGLSGFYSPVTGERDLTVPFALWGHVTGPAPIWARVIWAIALIAAAVLFILRQRLRAVAFLAAVILLIALPIVPLATTYFQWRYSFAFVAFSVAAFSVALGLSNRRQSMIVLVLLLATTTVMSISQRRYYRQLTARGIEQEGRYVWSQPSNAPILAASSPSWYIEGLRWLRKYEGRGEAPPAAFSAYAITVGGLDARRIVAVDRRGNPIPLTRTTMFGTPAEWEVMRKKYNPNAPLFVDFALRQHTAEWNLGPGDGKFVFLTDPGFSPTDLPRRGALRVPEARDRQYFRMVRQSPDGSWTVSPRLPVPVEGTRLLWRRGQS